MVGDNERVGRRHGVGVVERGVAGILRDVLHGQAHFVNSGGDPDTGRGPGAVEREGVFKAAVDADWELSRRYGVTGVPTFVAGRHNVVGAQPYEVFERVLARLDEPAFGGRLARDGDVLRVANRYDFAGLSHVDFRWTLEVDGQAVAEVVSGIRGRVPAPMIAWQALSCMLKLEQSAADEIRGRIVTLLDEWGPDGRGAEPRDLAAVLGDEAAQYDKITDILDVWFESGSSYLARRAAELVRSGRIGHVQRVEIGLPTDPTAPDAAPEPELFFPRADEARFYAANTDALGTLRLLEGPASRHPLAFAHLLQALAIAGDFNVAPEDRDVHNPGLWAGQILCSEPERAAFREFSSQAGRSPKPAA